MKKFSLKKISAQYKMTFGDYILHVSVDVEHKVLTVFFGKGSSYDKLIDAVMNARGHLREVTDDYNVCAVCAADSRMISLGEVKDLVVLP